MLPFIQIGPLAVQLPGLILLAGVWSGLSLAEKAAPHSKIHPNLLYNLVTFALIAGLLGARLAYALRYLDIFTRNPASLFSLNPGLLDPWGGLAAGLLAALAYGQRKGLALWPTLDALTPALAVFGVALGLANMASGAAFGAPTDLPWGIELWGARRHPSQVYETLAAGLILWKAWPGRWQAEKTAWPGSAFLTFIALSAGARLFLEAFRGDSTLMMGGLRQAQVVSWIVLGLSLFALNRLKAGQEGKAETVAGDPG